MKTRKLLITGAAGGIGSYIRSAFADRYWMRLLDVKEIRDPRGHEVIQGDITDLDQMRRACEGIDTVIHLAADPRTGAGFEALLPLTIAGPTKEIGRQNA